MPGRFWSSAGRMGPGLRDPRLLGRSPGEDGAREGLYLGPGPGGKIAVVPLCVNLPLPSDQSTTWRFLDLEVPEVVRWGPYLEGIQAHTNTRGASAAHAWKAVFYASSEGRDWPSTPTDLFSAIVGGSGYAIQTEYTSTSNLGMRMRYGLGVRSASAATVATAVVSCTLVFRFKS